MVKQAENPNYLDSSNNDKVIFFQNFSHSHLIVTASVVLIAHFFEFKSNSKNIKQVILSVCLLTLGTGSREPERTG